MQHFFVNPEQVDGEYIHINGGDVNHIKNVLRMKLNEELEINDGQGKKYLGTIDEFAQDIVIVKIVSVSESDTELPCQIYLFQGLPKGDKMELIVEKSVELGVSKIIPVETKRAIVKLDSKKRIKKVEKWNSVCKTAAKQSVRGLIPVVENVMTFKEAIEVAKECDHVLVPYELAKGMCETKEAISAVVKGDIVAVFIGPEGGFDSGEIELALANGAKPISLGKRILRTETAGITALSILMYHMETTMVSN